MIELIILVLILYTVFKLAWWLLKTAFVVSIFALAGLFLWGLI